MWKVITVLVPNAYILREKKTKMVSADTIFLGFSRWFKVLKIFIKTTEAMFVSIS